MDDSSNTSSSTVFGDAATRDALKLPDKIARDRVLIGWSMASSNLNKSIGFEFGDEHTRAASNVVDPLLFGDEGHLMTIAATGAGKGIGCVIPALLTHEGPMIVIDPKGENATVTKRYRESLGQKVYVIDPMDIVDGPSARLNPLDLVDPADPNCADEAAALASLMSTDLNRSEKDAFWTGRGTAVLTALILHAVASPDKTERTLPAIRRHIGKGIMSQGENYLRELLENSPSEDAREVAGAVSLAAQETLSGILSFAQEMVAFARGKPVQESLSASDIDLDAVRRGDPITIYIVLPPHMLESHAPLLRLWVGVLLKAIMRRRYKPEKPTMLLLDEAAQLGNFAPLRQAITLLRGYGLQTWSFWQDVDQLMQNYPNSWRTLVNNCRVVQAFGAPNMSAAASIARLFELPSPQAILDLEHDEMLLQVAGDDVILARRPNYLADPAFAGKWDDNPRYQLAPQQAATPSKPVRQVPNAYIRKSEDASKKSDAEIIRDLLDRFE